MKRIRSGMRHVLFLLPAFIGLLLYWVLPAFPQLTETVFSRGLFRIISVPLGALVAVLPISLTEFLAISALPVLVTLLILFIHRLRRSEARARIAARAGKAVGWFLSVAFLLYMLLHGVNYYRLPVAQLMGLDTATQTPAYLQQVCMELAKQASAARETVQEDADGCMKLPGSVYETLRRADAGYRELDDTMPYLFGGVWRAKPVQLSHWWSYTGITGMYFPMLAEANVNMDIPASGIPSTAAHELAHTRGFAREDECNFWAFLSCSHSPYAEFRYSGYLLAYVYCSNALYDYDTDMWDDVQPYISEGMGRDLRQNSAYWKQFEGKIQEQATDINNSFIQIQGVEEGVLSYDEMVRLVVGYYEKIGFTK